MYSISGTWGTPEYKYPAVHRELREEAAYDNTEEVGQQYYHKQLSPSVPLRKGQRFL